MTSVLLAECERAGLDPKRVGALARRLSKNAADAQAMGLSIFGGSGTGSIRWHDPISNDARQGPLVVAFLSPYVFDGGDGACTEDELGLMRGEGA